MHICLISTEVLGPFKNGGVGTSVSGLAQWLATAGHDVSILYTTRNGTEPFCAVGSFDGWVSHYAASWNIDLVALPDPENSKVVAPPALTMAYAVHDWLKNKQCDIAIFCDCCGPSYYCGQAKLCGTHYQATAIIIVAHGSGRWVRSIDDTCDVNTDYITFEHAEESAIACCDVLVSPSRYLLDWMNEELVSLPDKRLALPNILTNTATIAPPTGARDAATIDELVYFGRLEIRKGIELFCDAIEQLIAERNNQPLPKKVTFLGRCSRIGAEHAGAYLLRRSHDWPIETEFNVAADQGQALAYLKQPGRLAVMPSLADNLPSVVIECLENAIPFLAGNVGGACELVDPRDHDEALVQPDRHVLAAAITRVLQDGIRPARSAITRDSAIEGWTDLIAETAAGLTALTGMDKAVVLAADKTFEICDGRRARILMKPGVELDDGAIQAMRNGLRTAPIVVASWLDGDTLHVPKLDLGTLMTTRPIVAVCAVETHLLASVDRHKDLGEMCRELILAGHQYIVLPDAFCKYASSEDVGLAGNTEAGGTAVLPYNLNFGERVLADMSTLLAQCDISERQAVAVGSNYAAVPFSDILLELNQVDHFNNPMQTMALMAAFLNRVGRRTAARTMIARWEALARATWSFNEYASIEISSLIEAGDYTVENVLTQEGFGFGLEALMLHPNAPSQPDACFCMDLDLFGHNRFTGKLAVDNLQSQPVELAASLHTVDSVIDGPRIVVQPGAHHDLDFRFEPVAGAVELRLVTRMATGSTNNYFAWANWRQLTLSIFEP